MSLSGFFFAGKNGCGLPEHMKRSPMISVIPGLSTGILSMSAKAAEKMDKKAMTDIHDIKPVEEIGFVWEPVYLALIVAGVVVLVLAAYFIWKTRGRRKKIEIMELSAHEQALRLLDDLRDFENRDGKTFYFELSAIFRIYLQRRYGINAPEMTTEELLPRLKTLDLDPALQKELHDFCITADPIKFADAPVVLSKMESDLNLVKRFVKTTTPDGSDESGG